MNLSELRELIRAGDLDGVKAAIANNPDLLHTHDPVDDMWEERTALHCACRYPNLDIVKFLVEAGAEVYTNPMNTYPPIFIADHCRHFADRSNAQHIVDYFLNEIPDKAEGTQGLGITINLAARAGWTDIVRKHIEKDPLSVYQRGWVGDSPLHWPCHNGHADIVELLLDHGADIEADEVNCYGGKPLHWASEHEPAIVELLLKRGAEVDSRNAKNGSDFKGMTPLLMNCAMKDDCAEVTRLLLEAGCDTSVKHNGKTALEIAKEKENTKIVAVLEQFLGSEGSITLPQVTVTQFTEFAAAGDLAKLQVTFDVVQELKQSELDEAMWQAAANGHYETVKWLLEKGAHPDAPCESDRGGPTTSAIINGHFKIANLLLDHGADPSTSFATADMSIAGYALHCENEELVNRVYVLGGRPNIYAYVRANRLVVLAELLEYCPDVPCQRPKWDKPVSLITMIRSEAAWLGNSEAMALVLQKRPDVGSDMKDLIESSIRSHNRVFPPESYQAIHDLLIEHAPEHVHDSDFLPLHWLARTSDYYMPDDQVRSYAKHFLAHGVSLDRADDDGRTATELAEEKVRPALVEVLSKS
ncbi:MAG: ankyrin repeat domain-containing protein [Planctomycetota bacterium]